MYYAPTPYDYAKGERKAIHSNANRVGAVLLLTVGLQLVAVFADVLLGIVFYREAALSLVLEKNNLVDYMWLTLGEYLFYMGVPVFVGWLLLRKRGVRLMPREKTDGSFGVGLLLLCTGMMVIANIIGSYILTAFEAVGISPLDIPETQDGTVTVMLLNVLTVGIAPAILEELLFRGVVLQGLRPAGDGVALTFSALMFGLMHGTLYQIPFAFILGLVFGYIVLKTGNILWSMGLHAINNVLAVLMEYWLWDLTDEQSAKWYLLFFVVESLLGIIGAAVLMTSSHPRVLPIGDRISSWLTLKQRRRAVYSAGTVIAFVVVMLLVTVSSIQFNDVSLPDNESSDIGSSLAGDEEQQSARVFMEVVR